MAHLRTLLARGKKVETKPRPAQRTCARCGTPREPHTWCRVCPQKTDISRHHKIGAARLGVSYVEYMRHITAGEKWCAGDQDWHPLAEFGFDRSRSDGRASHCLKFHRERQTAKRRSA